MSVSACPGDVARQRGFTLFEILIAVSIFAVIGVISMTSLIQVGRSGERITEVQKQLANIQFALGYLGRDILQLAPRKVRDQYGDEQPQFILNKEFIVLTRSGWQNLLNAPRSELQRVAYRFEDGRLIRDFWLQLDQGFEEQRVQQALLDGLEELRFGLLDANGETLDDWPPLQGIDTTAVPVPVALEVSMSIDGFGRLRRVFEISDAIR